MNTISLKYHFNLILQPAVDTLIMLIMLTEKSTIIYSQMY